MRVWMSPGALLLVGLAAACPAAWGQEPEVSAPALPDQPPALLAPAVLRYPEEAAGAQGDVVILVTVSVDGLVIDAVYQSGGPPVFVAPALEAARTLRFSPAIRGGRPIVVKLPATFHFEPPVEPAGDTATLRTEGGVAELVVEAHRDPTVGETRSTTTLDVEALERASGESLAETIGAVPGVVVARTTGDGAKPIIRGQYERRLLVLFNGVRHESQKWGLDHSTEVDPFAAGAIHVVKGASGVRYGPDAIGGVVLVEPPPLRDSPGVEGKAALVGASNGWRGTGAARLDWVPERASNLTLRVEGNYARGASVHTPTYVLGNTGSEAWNAGITAGYAWSNGWVETSFHHFDLRAGVCYCARTGSTDSLATAAARDVPVNAESWTTSYTLDRPYQDVAHDLALARVHLDGPQGGEATVTYAFQSNRRLEFDHARESVTGPQFDFTLRTHSLDAAISHHGVELGTRNEELDADLHGELGVSGSFQENVYRGLPLVPNFRGLQGGIYGLERLHVGLWVLELGARYDHLSRTAFLTPSAFSRSVNRGLLTPDDCTVTPDAAACVAAYNTGSVSLGGLWLVVPGHVEARLDLSSASRFPNTDELYMSGTAPTSPVYAEGDPGLGPETTWGASPTLGLKNRWMMSEISVYGSYIHDYIYFAPDIGADGEPEVDVTITGSWPRYVFRPINAVFYGVDGVVSLVPEGPLGVDLGGSLVRGQEATTGDGLVMVPPARLSLSPRWSPASLGPLREPTVTVGLQRVFRQSHVPENADLVAPPPGYFLLGAGVAVTLGSGDHPVVLGLEGHNLLNQRYRDYSSLLRYYADEAGRDLRLRATMVI